MGEILSRGHEVRAFFVPRRGRTGGCRQAAGSESSDFVQYSQPGGPTAGADWPSLPGGFFISGRVARQHRSSSFFQYSQPPSVDRLDDTRQALGPDGGRLGVNAASVLFTAPVLAKINRFGTTRRGDRWPRRCASPPSIISRTPCRTPRYPPNSVSSPFLARRASKK